MRTIPPPRFFDPACELGHLGGGEAGGVDIIEERTQS